MKRLACASLFAAMLATRTASALPACTVPAQFKVQLEHPSGAAIYAELGAYYADHGQYPCASTALQKALAIEPDSARFNSLLGLSLYLGGNARQAVAPLQRALQLDPSLADARTTLAAALDRTGDRAGAEEQWRLVLGTQRSNAAALEGLSHDLLDDRNYTAVISLLASAPSYVQLPDPLAIDLSAAYSKVGLLQDATTLLQTRLEAAPSSLPVAEALSGVLILQSRFQDATAVLAPLTKQNPSDLHLQVLYLQTLVLAHNPAAESVAQQLSASHPHQAEVLYFHGLLREQQGDDPGAKEYFERAIRENPNDADSHYRLGVVLAALNESAAAKQQIERAIALGIHLPEVHMTLAKILRATGDAAGAQQQLALYQQQLQAQEARAQAAAKAQQGDQAEAAGNFALATQNYSDALALDPQEAVLAYKLAMALDKTGNRAGERAALEKAIADDPHMAVAQNQLGYLDSIAGNADAAIEHFQLALKDDPASVKTWLNLAAALCLESKWMEARDALRHVEQLDNENSAAAALLQRINEVTGQR